LKGLNIKMEDRFEDKEWKKKKKEKRKSSMKKYNELGTKT